MPPRPRSPQQEGLYFIYAFYFVYTLIFFVAPMQQVLKGESLVLFNLFSFIWYGLAFFTYRFLNMRNLLRVTYLLTLNKKANRVFSEGGWRATALLFLVSAILLALAMKVLGTGQFGANIHERANGLVKNLVSFLVLLLCAFVGNIPFSRPRSLILKASMCVGLISHYIYYLDRSVFALGLALVVIRLWYPKPRSLLLLPAAIILLDFLNLARFNALDSFTLDRIFLRTFSTVDHTVVYLSQAFKIYLQDGTFPHLIWNSVELFIPRAVWPTKPALSPTLFLTDYYGYNDGIGRPVGFWGEFVVALGLFGLLLGATLTGYVLKFQYFLLRKNLALSGFFFTVTLGGIGLSTPVRYLAVILAMATLVVVASPVKRNAPHPQFHPQMEGG